MMNYDPYPFLMGVIPIGKGKIVKEINLENRYTIT
jgi:hypothetical protein